MFQIGAAVTSIFDPCVFRGLGNAPLDFSKSVTVTWVHTEEVQALQEMMNLDIYLPPEELPISVPVDTNVSSDSAGKYLR